MDSIYLGLSQVLVFDVLDCFWSILFLNFLVRLVDCLIDVRFSGLVRPALAILLGHCGSSPHTWIHLDFHHVEVGHCDQERAKPASLELVP